MCMIGVVSLKPRCYKADIMAHGVEKQYVCDRGCVTKKSGCYLAYYLNLSSGEFTSISSNMCVSWYLHIFLLGNGSLTLMKMASLIDLAKFLLDLPPIPEELKDIPELERRLIVLHIPFMKVFSMYTYGSKYHVKGPCINVPT